MRTQELLLIAIFVTLIIIGASVPVPDPYPNSGTQDHYQSNSK